VLRNPSSRAWPNNSPAVGGRLRLFPRLMPQSPISDNPLVAFRILTNGTAIKAAHQVQSVGVSQRVNCVGSARRLLSPAMPPASPICTPARRSRRACRRCRTWAGPFWGRAHQRCLLRGLPAARVGDQALCVGPPDSIVRGSATVLIGGLPAARMGHATAHGSSIVLGCFTVLIGS